MTKESDKTTQYQAGSTILDEGVKFKIPFWFGTKLTLNISPLKPGTIVKISQQAAMLEDVNEGEQMVAELMRTGGNLRRFCRIIALAALNAPGRMWLAPWLSRVLMWRVRSTPELFGYTSLVYRQMGAEHFFFIMTLTKGMNFLRKKEAENTAAAKPSGEPSP